MVSHPNATVMRSEDFTSINVSWTSTDQLSTIDSLLPTYFIAYELRCMKCFSDSCESLQTINITELNTMEYCLSNITLWAAYIITVLSHYNFLSLPAVYTLRGPTTVHTIETKGDILRTSTA